MIRVTCPTDSWPNKPVTKVFPDLISAKKWAEWGHACVRGDYHSFEEIEEEDAETDRVLL